MFVPSDKEKARIRDYYQRQLNLIDSGAYWKEPTVKQRQASDKRNRVWRHNSFLGHSVMMRQHLNTIISADSTTDETKHIASSILGLVTKLQNSLQNRKD